MGAERRSRDAKSPFTEQSTATKQRTAQLTIQDHALAAGISNDLDQRNFQIQKLLFETPRLYAYFYSKAQPKDAEGTR